MAFDPLTAAFDLGGKLLDKFFPDPAQRDAAKLQLFQMQQTGELAELTATTDLAKAQIAVNQTEAGSNSLFKSNWRPFVGWVCGISFAYQFVLQPFIAFSCSALGHPVTLPAFDYAALDTALYGLLGIGGMRTFEKFHGVA